jgi:uncharacterized protein YbjT (DUF2867 family)
LILVTCSAGKTGRTVIAALAAAGRQARALVRREEAVAAALALGAADAAVGELSDLAALSRAMDGCEAVYYIPPNMDPDERAFGANVIAAARSTGARLVFHSVLHPKIPDLPHHWERHYVELAIIESGLSFTILQPGSYMQNMLPGWAAMTNSGVHRMSYNVDAPMSLVDLADLGEAALRVLLEDGYEHGIFELCGPVITLRQKAEILSRVLGKPVAARKQRLSDFLKAAAGHGASDYAQGCMAKMMPYYDRHGLVGSAKTLGWILGRPPTDFETFARRVAEAG